ncbi:MAG: hypothetical protein HY033_04635 [Ignavibacteriae bacterium]|nr:hypothetical protein [Ignavibacteria bacterium]MBI3364176.1 hypothetical protein [Ignavibacteriota bacterium]
MRDILHIVRFKFRTFLTLSTEWQKHNIVQQAASVFVFGGFILGAYLGARVATDYLLDTAKLGLFLLHRFISMALFVFFLSVNVGNIIVSYATLYRSPETAYYLTTPISHTSLFLVKFFDNFFYSSAAFFLIALSVLIGYGSHFHLPWDFYARTLMLMLFPFMLLSGCIAVMLLLVLMRYAHRIGIRKIIMFLVVLYLGVLFGYFHVTNPMSLVSSVVQHFPHVDQYFGYLDPAIAQFLPNHWIAESLYWTMRGDESHALSYTWLLLGTTGITFTSMVFIGKRLFYKSWLSSLDLLMAREVQSSRLHILDLTNPSRLNPQTSVLVKKEIWQFLREPSQWIHLGILAILIVTFLVSVAGIDFKQSLPSFQTISYLVLLIFSIFLIASIALRFVFPCISVEGANFWSILSAPVSRGRVFWIKFFLVFLPILLLSELLVIFSHRSLGKYSAVIEAAGVMMLCSSFALVSLNLGAGSFFANFRERNPIRIASSQSATLTFLLCIVYVVVLVGVFYLPLNGYFGYMLRGASFRMETFWSAVITIAAMSLIVGAVSLVLGYRALRRDY